MKYNFLVLGSSGMQGRIVVKDLLESGFKVYCADLYRDGSEENLAQYMGTPFAFIDLRNYDDFLTFLKTISVEVVINCVEGDWNHDVYRACLESGVHVIDLGSDIPMTKSQLGMDKNFKKANLTAITGCGSTPGINNIMMKHASQFFDQIDTIEVGFAWDSNIKKFVVPFSIESIIEELTEPAPVLENGVWLEKNPIESEITKEIREVGSQKLYFVHHPETYTFMHEYKKFNPKNIRFYAGFPEHSIEVLRKIIELGLGEKKLLTFEKTEIRPVDALSRILTRLPRPHNYTEKENLWVEVSGTGKSGGIKIIHMECIVSTLPGWTEAGCNVDTGLPASIIGQMIIDGRINGRGSFTPDSIVPVDQFFLELKKKGITVYQDGKAIN